MKLFYVSVIGLAALTLFSCNKENKELKGPEPLLLMPTHNDGRLSNEVLDKASLYYYMTTLSKDKKYVGDFRRSQGMGHQQGILYSTDVATISGAENLKTFYLTIPGSKTDTLIINYDFISDKEARQDPCYCRYPRKSVFINGKAAEVIGYNMNNVPIYKVPK